MDDNTQSIGAISRTHRENSLRRLIKRLDRKAEKLEFLSRRFSLVRIAIFLLGGLCTGLAAAQYGRNAGWLVFIVFLLIFLVVIQFHRRILRWIEMVHIWRDIANSQIARMTLDWDSIPDQALKSFPTCTPLEIDLDLTGHRSIHHLMDICISAQGSQLLADWLRQSDPDPERSSARKAIVSELVSMTIFRNKFLLTFSLASKENLQGEALLSWLAQDLPTRKLSWRLVVATGLVAANLVLFALFISTDFPSYWVITFGLYLAFYYFNIRDLNQFQEAIVHLDSELDKFWPVLRYLETAHFSKKPHLAKLLQPVRTAKQSPSDRLRRLKWITAGVGIRSNPIISIILNIVLPWDFLFAYLAAQARRTIAADLPTWLGLLDEFDAYTSLANFGYTNPEYTFAEIQTGVTPVLQVTGLGHPLLPPEQKVTNDFSISSLGEIVIITGSNMAGKSTFVKAIGINLCLAHAGAPVSATVFRAQPLRLHTCIKISDSLTDGFSYFYAEVKCLKRLSERIAAPGWPVLYLIDEIFRGTNNRERLIGSRAYLRSLVGTQAIGFLATHDIELASLAQEDALIANYHFRDRVEDGKLTFDYRLYPGPSPTTNALTIMKLEGLPVEGPSST